MTADGRIGLLDGSEESDSRVFHVVLEDDALVQLDELLVVETELPGGAPVAHYGIVTELSSRLEGAELSSDTRRVMDQG
nr:ATP-binding protein [Actinomycetota bacterium]